MSTPVYVFSGFLGSGKTTLINHLLNAAPRAARIMILVNEFGKLSVDKRLVRADREHVVDLSGGCICCGLFFELVASIRYALDTFRA
ncbi:MAG TPA: GTP-binding protein, partial [Deferrisomatales bacterium]|nr:GTP-binding protein [Deferrisomatales bacterium]